MAVLMNGPAAMPANHADCDGTDTRKGADTRSVDASGCRAAAAKGGLVHAPFDVQPAQSLHRRIIEDLLQGFLMNVAEHRLGIVIHAARHDATVPQNDH